MHNKKPNLKTWHSSFNGQTKALFTTYKNKIRHEKDHQTKLHILQYNQCTNVSQNYVCWKWCWRWHKIQKSLLLLYFLTIDKSCSPHGFSLRNNIYLHLLQLNMISDNINTDMLECKIKIAMYFIHRKLFNTPRACSLDRKMQNILTHRAVKFNFSKLDCNSTVYNFTRHSIINH